MCEVLDRAEARGKAIGEARGKAIGEEIGEARGKVIGETIGIQRTLISLVKKNLLPIGAAAAEAGTSEVAFKRLAGFV